MLTYLAGHNGADITTVAGSHAVHLTQPDAVTEVIVATAEGASVVAAH